MLYLLPQAVDRVSDTDPERVAARCREEDLTYGELTLRSNALARCLVSQGVERGARIGIYANKGLSTTIAMYGIMKAGAAYVPLDPRAPLARTRQIVDGCAMQGVVSEDSKRDDLRQICDGGGSLRFAIGLESSAGNSPRAIAWSEVGVADSPPDVSAMEQDLAYILYTSGSTGTPKGIMHTHRSALSWAEVAAMTYGFEPSDRLSNHAPLHFDLSTLDYFATAVAGATTVIIPEEYTKLPASLSQLMSDEKLTVFYSVPFALIQLLLYGAIETRDLSSLRWVLFGGEPFPTKHLRALMQELPKAQLCNVYGPTEVNGCTHFVVPDLPAESDEPVPIGRPYANVQALVVDGNDREVEAGHIGELLIRAPTRMRGYWDDPELTRRSSYSHARAGAYRDSFHRTGDLVQPLADGSLRFVGRRDRQVKLRGHRVELDEIEAALSSHTFVAEAAVYLVVDGDERQTVRASVTCNGASDPTGGDLRKYLRELLPWYAIPESIDRVDSFPRTSTGKIDRRELQTRAQNASVDVPATGEGAS